MTIANFDDALHRVQGKTIAVVYIFEGEESEGFDHYDIWQSDVISEWLGAIQENHCRPLIMDVRTFVQKAMNNTLPHLDFVLNLNAGNRILSTLGLVPSVCSFLNIPCIPCNTVAIIAGEHKGIANYVADAARLNLPMSPPTNKEGIFRPMNFGSSRGVVKGTTLNPEKNGIFQEFIQGYDITTPVLYNPIDDDLQVLPSVMYYSDNKNIEWFFTEEVKEKRGGYQKKIVQIDRETELRYIDLAKKIGVNCYCRIDARVRCESQNEWETICTDPIPADKIFFVEINPMPTLKPNINIHNSINALNITQPFYECYSQYKKQRNVPTPTGFLLLCSMLAVLKPGVEEKGI